MSVMTTWDPPVQVEGTRPHQDPTQVHVQKLGAMDSIEAPIAMGGIAAPTLGMVAPPD
jgi:hypothetical protein